MKLLRVWLVTLSLGFCFAARSQSDSMPASGWFDVRSYGAVPDGSTKSTEAVAKAIAAASAKGGGTIYFPPGVFLTGPIHLVSHISLYVDAGSVVKFSTNFDDYLPMVPSRWEGIEITNFSPLIYAQNAVGITIQGRGTLDGQGQAWWARLSEVRKMKPAVNNDKYAQEYNRLNPHPLVADSYKTLQLAFLRPPFIQPFNCTNVLIEGVTIINSPFWTVTPVYCDNLTVHAVVIQNPLSPNTDGIDPDSCSNVHISDCHISVGDDCIAIKSGRDADGRRVGRPAINHTIDNCTMLSGHGGVVIGSETSGGVKNISIANCVFDGTDRGIRIKSARGRGAYIEDVRVANIVMRNIRDEALVITTFYEKSSPEAVTERTPIFKNIHISGITGDARIAADLSGLTEMPLDGISITDFNINASTGIGMLDVKNVGLHNVTVNVKKGPLVVANHADGLELDGVRTFTGDASQVLAHLSSVKNVFIHGCSVPEASKIAIQVTQESVNQLQLEGNHFGKSFVPVIVKGE